MKQERTRIDSYPNPFALEEIRGPARGGSDCIWFGHQIMIDSVCYSYVAQSYRKWVYASDTVEFEWLWDSEVNPIYRVIVRSTIKVWDKNGNSVTRGNRSLHRPHLRDNRDPMLERRLRTQRQVEIRFSQPSQHLSEKALKENVAG